MKPAQIFNQYIWIINALRAYRKLTLDRMTKVELTDETFEMPADFSSEAYFSDYYGVKTDGTTMSPRRRPRPPLDP